jgi:hypothetical protein
MVDSAVEEAWVPAKHGPDQKEFSFDWNSPTVVAYVVQVTPGRDALAVQAGKLVGSEVHSVDAEEAGQMVFSDVHLENNDAVGLILAEAFGMDQALLKV